MRWRNSKPSTHSSYKQSHHKPAAQAVALIVITSCSQHPRMVAATRRGSSAAKTFVHDLLLAALSLLEPTCPDDLLAALQRHLYTMYYSQ